MPSKKQIEQQKITQQKKIQKQARPEMEQSDSTEFQDVLQAQKQTKHPLKKGAHAAPEDSDEDANTDDFSLRRLMALQNKQMQKRPAKPLPWYQRAWNFAKTAYSFVDELCTVDAEMSLVERSKARVNQLDATISQLESPTSSVDPYKEARLAAAKAEKTALETSISQQESLVGMNFSQQLGTVLVDESRAQISHKLTGSRDFSLVNSVSNFVRNIGAGSKNPYEKGSFNAAGTLIQSFGMYAQITSSSIFDSVGARVGSFLHTYFLKPFLLDTIKTKLSHFGATSDLARGLFQRIIFSEGTRNFVKNSILKTNDDNHFVLTAMRHAELGLVGYRAYNLITQMRAVSHNFDFEKIEQDVIQGRMSMHAVKNLIIQVSKLSIDLTTLLQRTLPEKPKAEVEGEDAPKESLLPGLARFTLETSKSFLQKLFELIIGFDKKVNGFECIESFIEPFRENN